jgi:peptide/nickel transport system substrate-binding protein
MDHATDSSTAAAALQRGEVDWLQQPLLDLVPMLGQTAGIKIEAVDQFGNLAILRFNHLLPPFDNPEMRRAVLPGIDQMAVVGDQAEFGRTPVGFFTAGGPMANDAGIQALTGPRGPDEVRRRIAAGAKQRDPSRWITGTSAATATVRAMSPSNSR